ncbi:conserved hypothetical protein [Tenacibaculum sp. 190524A05c]|uniref:hypothetical protein n=1 Tax=Tenacibaculum platacis TaxID=3137852 RepID=UPI0031FB79EE
MDFQEWVVKEIDSLNKSFTDFINKSKQITDFDYVDVYKTGMKIPVFDPELNKLVQFPFVDSTLDLNNYQSRLEKDAVNGYAGLDENLLLEEAFIPQIPTSKVQSLDSLLSGKVSKTGDEITGDLLVNTSGASVSNSLKTRLFVKDDSSELGTSIPFWLDVVRNNANSTDAFYGGMIRADYKGSDPIKEVFSSYLIGRHSGSGYVESMGALIALGSHRSQGDVGTLFGVEGRAVVDDYGGNGNVGTVLNRLTAKINNSNKVVDDVFASSATLELIKGEVSNRAYVLEIDCKQPAVANDPQLNVDGDFAYIGCDDTGLNFTPGGDAYFLKSEVALPSKLSGRLFIDVPLSEIVSGHSKTAINKEYLESLGLQTNQDARVETYDNFNTITSAVLNSNRPNDPVGTILVNTNSSKQELYVRHSSTQWFKYVGVAI